MSQEDCLVGGSADGASNSVIVIIVINSSDIVSMTSVLMQEDQLGISLLTLEQLESEDSQKKIETRVHEQQLTAA